MKVFIWTKGDPSVGINGHNAEVDLTEEDHITIKEYRECVRTELKQAFGNIWEEFVHVAFEDELDAFGGT